MKVIILTGPAGAGKNTIGYLLSKKRVKCAIIDVDLVRWMLCQPHKGPWEGEEGVNQQKLGIENTVLLTNNFLKNSTDVIILDVVTNETAKKYREELKEFSPKIILLLPTFKETQKRVAERKFRIALDEEKLVYKWQQELLDYDTKIDNTFLSAEKVAEKLNRIF